MCAPSLAACLIRRHAYDSLALPIILNSAVEVCYTRQIPLDGERFSYGKLREHEAKSESSRNAGVIVFLRWF